MEQKQFGTGSIELTKFPQHLIQQVNGIQCIILPLEGANSRLLNNSDGRVFLNFSWRENESQYSTHIISPTTTKAERDARVQFPIIGNLKEYKPQAQAGWGQPQAPAQSGWGQSTAWAQAPAQPGWAPAQAPAQPGWAPAQAPAQAGWGQSTAPAQAPAQAPAPTTAQATEAWVQAHKQNTDNKGGIDNTVNEALPF